MEKIYTIVHNVIARNQFLQNHNETSNIKNKLYLQIIISGAFLLLSITNIIAKSFIMFIFTILGFLINGISAYTTKKYENTNICVYTSIFTCSILFGFFVIYGGNDGFSCFWVILLPFFSMIVMNFSIGFFTSVFFQIFLIVVFWTPIRDMLYYHYNDQFCMRFPLFFFVTFMLGLALTLSLQKSQYNEYQHLLKLEEMNGIAYNLARVDPLTNLANRRCAYEQFNDIFADESNPHCIIMGDIDYFKQINDAYGHEFGDKVLVTLSDYIKKLLPEDYLKSRWGGEEFLIAANEPLQKVYEEIENLRKNIAKHKFNHNGEYINVTITFGITEFVHKSELNNAINNADIKLYEGKNATRNCTIIN